MVFSQGHGPLQISDYPDAILGRCGVRGNVRKTSAASNITGKKLHHSKRNIKWQVAHVRFVLATYSGYHGTCLKKFKPGPGSGLFFLRTAFCVALFLCFLQVVTNIRFWFAKRLKFHNPSKASAHICSPVPVRASFFSCWLSATLWRLVSVVQQWL